MTPEQNELAYRLIGHPAFKWSAGMLTHEGYRLIRPGRSPDLWVCAAHDKRALGRVLSVMTLRLTGSYPDLSDPATVGCLLALVREVYKAPALYVAPVYEFDGRALYVAGWTVYPGDHRVSPTEGEALALAILGVT